jgi:response regulator RpfG family c-di-GMP phosphodiesterase
MSKHKLLLVDDEQGILDALTRLLFEEDYEIETATSGKDALQKMSTTTFSLIISDQRMPEMTGAQFLQKARELHSDTIRIMLTGYTDIKDAVDAINQGGIYRYINKPWNDDELKLVVKQALKHYNLIEENRQLHTLIKDQNEALKEINKNLEQRVKERTQQIEGKNKELESNFITSIRVFSGLIAYFDEYLGQHSKRVALFARRLAQHLNLPEQEVLDIEIAGLLHDIGSISLPKRIFYVERRSLNKTEIAQLERHPLVGQELLVAIEKLKNVGIIIRHHHECYDGTGYPDGLRGKEIPLGARIIAVVDSYDFKANARGYSQDASPQLALGELTKQRGSGLDPEIVNAFLDLCEGSKAPQDGERALSPSQLEKGMKLSRNLVTKSGQVLMKRDALIQEKDLERIKNPHDTDPIVGKIYVYTSKPTTHHP